ncbi:inovirus Gp2 family protein [Pseudomonas putida]|uniref:inovirus Gp2 family protein n=1 Tax=Pseudomonas putida TaxID=303 RepID=UPI000648BE06|nr:inovirus Gp2 family protein [Pseudomonas putida]
MSSLLNNSNRQLLRHPDNSNLRLYHDDTFEGFPLMVEKGPFIREYLSRLRHTIELTLDQYPRMVAVRVDLRLPLDIGLPDYAYTNRVISRFFESFNGKIEYHRRQLREQSRYARGCKVRYVWSREVSQGGRQHYHVLILLNRDAYYGMGRLGSERVNIISRMEESWASALGISVDNISGLVHIPEKAVYRINRDGYGNDVYQLREMFCRASYLCKTATKSYGDRQRAFDTSRG